MMELNKENIINLLITNDKAVGRALSALKQRQTIDEQQSYDVRHVNGRGFCQCDARVGTSMAEYFEKHDRLTPKQLAYWRSSNKKGVRIGKYWKQLIEVAKEKRRD